MWQKLTKGPILDRNDNGQVRAAEMLAMKTQEDINDVNESNNIQETLSINLMWNTQYVWLFVSNDSVSYTSNEKLFVKSKRL